MNQSVLVDADVDERAELGDVGDDAFEDHSWLNVGDLADFFGEAWSDELLARIAARLSQFLQNVLECERTGGDLAGDRPRPAAVGLRSIRRPVYRSDRAICSTTG